MSEQPTTNPPIQIDVNAYVARWQAEANKQTDRAIQAELALEQVTAERDEAQAALNAMLPEAKTPGGKA